MKEIKNYFNQHPLRVIIILGFLLRLVAVIFSKGFGMHDDHFCVIEVAQGWINGENIEGWLTSSMNEIVSGKSYFYPGLHYILFWLLEAVHIYNPDVKMFIVRLLHALWSLLVVYYGYKITYKVSTRKNAITVGVLCAALWFMPAISVKNLVEVASIPFLMLATWIAIKEIDQSKRITNFIWIGVLVSLAFSTRYQTALYSAGIVIALMLRKDWKAVLLIGIGALVPFLIIHGWMEYKMSGVAFGRLQYYVIDNINHATSYINLPWYNYIILVCGVLIPPLGVFLFIGTFKTWKKHAVMFIGLALFFVFHSYFPNKQERFMFTMIPFFIILGVIGWSEITEKYTFWKKNRWIMKFSWIWFWILNTLVIFILSTYYSKRSRVEAMLYLYDKNDVQGIIVENRLEGGAEMLPRFYAGTWAPVYKVTKQDSLFSYKEEWAELPESEKPNYILFTENQDDKLEDRIEYMKHVFPDIRYETTVEVSVIDRIHADINPHVDNDRYYIYKIYEYAEDIDN